MSTITDNPKVKYIAYLRKSSEGEERQMLSIVAQRDELEKVVQRDNLEVVEWIEEAHSAKHPNTRERFAEMLSKLDKGEANGILTWNPNRLSRNSVDTGAIVYMFDINVLAEVRTPQQIFRDTPNDKFLLGLFCNQAKLENDNKGVDVKRGLAKKAEMGWLPSGAVIGYINTPDKAKGFKTIEKDPERFDMVRRIWDLMLTGQYTTPQIWKLTRKWGLRTVKRGKIGGKLLSKSAIYAILTNPFYYGWFEFPRKSGVWIKGEHQPMITQEEFDRVQELLGRTGTPRSKESHDFTFTGLMKCRNCNSSITAEAKTKKQKNGNVHHYVYYHCTKRKDENCTERSIELKSLNKQVDALLERLTISERFKEWAIKHLHEVRKNEANSHEAELRGKHKELEQVVEQIDALMLKYTSPDNVHGDLISSEELQSMKGPLLKRKAALEADLKVQSKEIEDWVVLTEKTFNFACYARVWFKRGDKNTRRAILACLGSNLLVKDRKIHIELHPYYQTIFVNKEKAEREIVNVRTSKKPYVARQKGTFVPSCPVGLPRQDSNLRPIDYTFILDFSKAWTISSPAFKAWVQGASSQNESTPKGIVSEPSK